MHLRQPGFMYSAYGPFTKIKERMQKFKETGDSRYKIYQNESGKACFQHHLAYGVLRVSLEEQLLIKYCVLKHLVLLKTPNMMDINMDLLQWFINSLIKDLLMVIPYVMLLCTTNRRITQN